MLSTNTTAFTSATGTLDPAAWQELAGAPLYTSAPWLSFCRSLYGDRAGAVHTGRDGAPAAGIAVTELRSEASNPFYRWSTPLTAAGLPTPGPTGLLVGQQSGYQTHLLHTPDTTPATAADAVTRAVRDLAATDDFRARVGRTDAGAAPSVGMFLSTADVRAFRAAAVTTEPLLLQLDAWIPVPEGGWDGYLAVLDERRRKWGRSCAPWSVKSERRKFAAAGYTVEHHRLADCVKDVGHLLAQTERRHGNDVDPDDCASTFAHQAAATDSRGEVLLCRDESGRAVGFCLFYEWRGAMYLRAVGFDYERLKGANEYFNLVYYRPLEIAAERGLSWYHAGIEAPEAKALRGAELRGLWLLDLTADSVLAGHGDTIRAANHAFLARAAADSRVVGRSVRQDVWDLAGTRPAEEE
ncbi:GNAT family N-acetyltransferase [Streptomyces cinnabarinus]|uniref:GNAT family N-acetyltransferase n=1 Tax=Streptomyces cinnabarinus TaxID=67287 RepID=A0ABY7KBB1_9ACTN|nr:peptidogalycan biosysnthesis protein [Streptomyces cinnabarinus]WAZ21797.1 GNAT family N-acetyltransferase [Streptomyces cinnabarinus]